MIIFPYKIPTEILTTFSSAVNSTEFKEKPNPA